MDRTVEKSSKENQPEKQVSSCPLPKIFTPHFRVPEISSTVQIKDGEKEEM